MGWVNTLVQQASRGRTHTSACGIQSPGPIGCLLEEARTRTRLIDDIVRDLTFSLLSRLRLLSGSRTEEFNH